MNVLTLWIGLECLNQYLYIGREIDLDKAKGKSFGKVNKGQ
ncbi:hypothetical protein O53_2220 [Microcystis aeruginosa TAIHU98]|uniref:Uncharacterized protein n=2 Tax=Microcystis aeruginosa TaxID=1126 RepID=L7E3G6_MICAE|nr:hypothetical protein BH695_0689 [Microcystis aeruginosa PCC 7806SL]ELP53416.1 hypothetical protein O53_2220 [Microcystis aeruginosa TAIHU98]ELS47036.1 hypothetical protein C789_3181 [Microcystis aeruginosa FACHB-905 = DIANCHI905]